MVRREMVRRGWDLGAMAEHAGISRVTLRKVLASRAVYARTARRIVEAFETNPPILDPFLEQKTA